jgi:hypothetical protein
MAHATQKADRPLASFPPLSHVRCSTKCQVDPVLGVPKVSFVTNLIVASTTYLNNFNHPQTTVRTLEKFNSNDSDLLIVFL